MVILQENPYYLQEAGNAAREQQEAELAQPLRKNRITRTVTEIGHFLFKLRRLILWGKSLFIGGIKTLAMCDFNMTT